MLFIALCGNVMPFIGVIITVTLPAGVGYTSYVAIVTQASTNAPVATVLSIAVNIFLCNSGRYFIFSFS